MLDALRFHWPEYLIEGALLGAFMVAACVGVFLIEHPASPAARRVRPPLARRALMGVLMGITAVALIYSPWGARSGAHMNPGTTLSFLVLGKVAPWDAAFYIAAQFAGGLAGVLISGLVLRSGIRHASVNHAVTVPGPAGVAPAWAAEFAISMGMMVLVLWSSNRADAAPFTGWLAGALLAVYITVEAPLSGMSINPARTLASALPARTFRGLWVYFTAPPLGMLCAALAYTAVTGDAAVRCAKLNHAGDGPCIFRCRIAESTGAAPLPGGTAGIEQADNVRVEPGAE